jgi:hypothetical protein
MHVVVWAAVVACVASASAQDESATAALPDQKQHPADTSARSQSSAAAVEPIPQKSETGKPEVHLVGMRTDVAKRYKAYIPALPVAPFTEWRKWFVEHEDSVHCFLEWRNEKGEWFHGEMRSKQFDPNAQHYLVGAGEFPGTAFDAYGIYIMPGRMSRKSDHRGRPIEIVLDEVLNCDYRDVERELRKYGSKDAHMGQPGTGGDGKTNVGLGGPAYKPSQNSNTMVKFILRACGVNHKSPECAVGWDSEPTFPFSSNADAPALDVP